MLLPSVLDRHHRLQVESSRHLLIAYFLVCSFGVERLSHVSGNQPPRPLMGLKMKSSLDSILTLISLGCRLPIDADCILEASPGGLHIGALICVNIDPP